MAGYDWLSLGFDDPLVAELKRKHKVSGGEVFLVSSGCSGADVCALCSVAPSGVGHEGGPGLRAGERAPAMITPLLG
jgi:hypothetical protein